MRGDDRAGLPEAGQLQGDRGANDRRLPFERRGEIARPVEPVIARPLEKVRARRVDGAQERFVLAEDQVQRTGQRKGDLADDVGERARWSSAACTSFAADVADVIGADDDVGRRTPISVGRANPNGEARQTGDRLDAADDLRRPIRGARTDRSAARNRSRAASRPSSSVRIVSTIAVLRT